MCARYVKVPPHALVVMTAFSEVLGATPEVLRHEAGVLEFDCHLPIVRSERGPVDRGNPRLAADGTLPGRTSCPRSHQGSATRRSISRHPPRPGETPADAALREAREETGLNGFKIVRKLGGTEYDTKPVPVRDPAPARVPSGADRAGPRNGGPARSSTTASSPRPTSSASGFRWKRGTSSRPGRRAARTPVRLNPGHEPGAQDAPTAGSGRSVRWLGQQGVACGQQLLAHCSDRKSER